MSIPIFLSDKVINIIILQKLTYLSGQVTGEGFLKIRV